MALKIREDKWTSSDSDGEEYVFCHNDVFRQNVIVDPDMLKTNAIADREYAGFYPKYFEFPFYTGLGPWFAIK